MTRANIEVNGDCFHVTSDGMYGDEIKETLERYIEAAKGKLKNLKDIADWVISAMYRDGDDYYNWIQVGDINHASCEYKANINARGKLSFKQLKGTERNI